MTVRHWMRRVLVPLAGAAVALSMSTLTTAPAQAASSKATTTHAKVIRWVDGDTVVTTHGRIRLIGVDTPEVGRCGAAHATALAKHWAPKGSTIRLVNPASVKNTDRYGRYLRYVGRGSVDVSRAQIRHGAKARYDSTDGYQHHPRQADYHRVDRAHRDYRCTSGGGGGSAKPQGWDCPSAYPIKGNESSHIYHMPGQRYYDATNPEVCFSTRSAAERAGYRAAKV